MLEFAPNLKVGDRVTQFQLIGKVGKTGTQSSHCHFEIHKHLPESWTGYVNGWSKEKVLEHYEDPNPFIDKARGIPCKYDSYGGYEWLSPLEDGSGYHPGVDINAGSGDEDNGNDIFAPISGEIAYMGVEEGNWGNHLYIEADEEHWSDEAMEWNLEHGIITEKKDPNKFITWGEYVVTNQRLAEKIISWSNPEL